VTADSTLVPLRASMIGLPSTLVAATLAYTPVTPLDTLTSGLASITRLPFGTDVAEARRTASSAVPSPSLVLYDIEGSAECRRVRELLVYLDLCCTIRPCAVGSRHLAEAAELAGGVQPSFPFLVDESAGVSLSEPSIICDHLTVAYGRGVEPLEPPAPLLLALPALFRPGRGTAVDECARGRSPPEQILRLYSYDGNQFCRLVREVLCELDLAYELRSTGKGSPRREELKALSGKTTAPFLVDPNTETAMGESADIVDYLWGEYGGK